MSRIPYAPGCQGFVLVLLFCYKWHWSCHFNEHGESHPKGAYRAPRASPLPSASAGGGTHQIATWMTAVWLFCPVCWYTSCMYGEVLTRYEYPQQCPHERKEQILEVLLLFFMPFPLSQWLPASLTHHNPCTTPLAPSAVLNKPHVGYHNSVCFLPL